MFQEVIRYEEFNTWKYFFLKICVTVLRNSKYLMTVINMANKDQKNKVLEKSLGRFRLKGLVNIHIHFEYTLLEGNKKY